MNEDLAARLTLVCLSKMGPVRARWLLDASESSPIEAAPEAVQRIRDGRLPATGAAPPGMTMDLFGKWRGELRTFDVEARAARHAELGIEMMSALDPRWPLQQDPDPAVILFYSGDLGLLSGPPAVAVVGTRRCTTVGRTVAYDMGRRLAEAGLAVTSGLALGVDGAAHRGASDIGGAMIGVVGSGIDVVYPGGNRSLWQEVASSGLLLSEAPAGSGPQRWRFPARNRLIAGLSRGVVIVESHRSGGALLTGDEAAERGLPVFAVPGSVLSSASDGTNGLLIDGATPVRDADDVVAALGLDPGSASAGPGRESAAGPSSGRQEPIDALEAAILAEVATGPTHVDRLVAASGRSAAEVLAAVQSLVSTGQVQLDGSTVSRS